jgi:hypothetical protein
LQNFINVIVAPNLVPTIHTRAKQPRDEKRKERKKREDKENKSKTSPDQHGFESTTYTYLYGENVLCVANRGVGYERPIECNFLQIATEIGENFGQTGELPDGILHRHTHAGHTPKLYQCLVNHT